MSTLYELDSYVRGQKPRRRNAEPPTANANPKARVAAANSRSRARALAALGGNRALALSRPLDYEIVGTVAELRQPTRMACWATVYTMMVAWRDQRSMSIDATLGTIGQKWVDLFKADTGASAEQEAELWAASGLVAEPLASHSLESWEGLLRTYGPLAVIVDVDPGDKRAIHVLLVTGIHGDGTADGTTATIVDPARGDKRPVKFSTLLSQYEQGAARRTASKRHNQIIHWPKDVKFAGAKAYAYPASHAFNAKTAPPAKVPTPSAPLAPQPWSHYFQFRKGSTFEVDGPLTYNGTGEVIERTADYLKFSMRMPAVSIFGQGVPAADMVLEATYKKEGKGNHVRATINGAVAEDIDAEIVSSGDTRTIRPRFSGLAGPAPEWITVRPDGDSEIDLDMRIDGRDVDFDLNRTGGSSGMALGIAPWSASFPFAGGTAFLVDGPFGFNGRGRVLERSDTVLKFEIAMPEARVFGTKVPKLDLLLEAIYTKEGAGNKVELTVNGTKHADINATIKSDSENRRTIVPSIVLPGTKVDMIAVAPAGRDKMKLAVTIEGTKHDFDLEKLKGPEAKSWVRGFASSSTAADGLREVVAFAARTTPTRWKLTRADVAKRLRELVTNPDLVDQGGLNLCGPAAFFHVYARRDPVAFVKYASDLFEKGTGSIGTLTVKPKDDLVLNDYARLVPKMNPVTPVGEWMCLSALRDSENAVIRFEGDPSENVAGMTTPGELADWMKKSGIYTKVSDEGNWVSPQGFNHAMALAPAANRDILMLINAHIIQAHAGRKKLLDSFPNHFIQLHTRLSTVQRGGTQFVEFDYWTWGMPGLQHASVSTRSFIENYYGTVTGDV